MADNNFFFKVLAELGYFNCFYILLFFPQRGGGGGGQTLSGKFHYFFIFFLETFFYAFQLDIGNLEGILSGRVVAFTVMTLCCECLGTLAHVSQSRAFTI